MKIKTIVWILFSVFLSSFFFIQLLSTKINPILYNYINLEVERITSNIVDGTVNEILSDDLDDDLFTITKNSDDSIAMVDYNTKKVNTLLKKISNDIQKKLIMVEDGNLSDFMVSDTFRGKNFKSVKNGVVCEVPIGSLSGNGFLSNIGPVIPIKMSFLGQVATNLKTKATNYGINNLCLEISIHVEVKEQITMPKLSKNSTIKIDAPLTIKIIQGVVPKYYGGSIDKNSNIISLPSNF